MKLLVKTMLMDYLYKVSNQYYEKNLEKIIDSNNKINGLKTQVAMGSVIYNNIVYRIYASGSSKYKFCLTFPLDPSLHQEMDIYLDGRKTLEKEIPQIERFLTILLNFCNSKEDLKFLLGDHLYSEVAHFVTFQQPHKELESLESFKRANQHYIDTMYQRHLDNVLMTGIYNEN